MKQKITQSHKASTHLVPSQTISLQSTPDSTTTKQTKEAENQTKPQGLNYSLNQVCLCTTRLDDGITNMERYVFSRKPGITAAHKPYQPSKPLPMNNQTLSLPIAPPPPIPTNQTDSQTQSVTIPKPLTTPKPQSLHLLTEIRDWSEANRNWQYPNTNHLCYPSCLLPKKTPPPR